MSELKSFRVDRVANGYMVLPIERDLEPAPGEIAVFNEWWACSKWLAERLEPKVEPAPLYAAGGQFTPPQVPEWARDDADGNPR